MKKTLIPLLLISIVGFLLISTYAKYLSEYEKITTANLAKWQLLINNSDISNNSDFSSSITPVFDDNPHISNNIIAPTSSGYFDLEIDCSNTDLSFSYAIDIANSASDVLDFKVTGYSLDGGEIVPFSEASITDSVLTSSNIDKLSYRFFVEWDDSENNMTNNIEDTQLSINSVTSTINVNISFSQLTNS